MPKVSFCVKYKARATAARVHPPSDGGSSGDAIGCGAAAEGSPGREPRECAEQECEAAEQRRKTARSENQRRCSAAFSYLGHVDLRFHRRLPTTAAPQRITMIPPINGCILSGKQSTVERKPAKSTVIGVSSECVGRMSVGIIKCSAAFFAMVGRDGPPAIHRRVSQLESVRTTHDTQGTCEKRPVASV